MRCALVTPIGPLVRGNGLAHRARFWQRTLGELGDLTTFIVPVSGPAEPAPGDVVVGLLPPVVNGPLPQRATRATATAATRLRPIHGPFDLVVAFRSYTAPFALGLADVSTRIVVDLDDDDAAFYADDPDEASRFARLVHMVTPCVDLVVTATPGTNARLIPNCVDVPEPNTTAHDRSGALMVGNFAYRPNADGARWVIDNVLPLVKQARTDFDLRFAGPASELLGAYGRGFVDDLAPLYAQAALALVPLHRGSGSHLKVLEAWSHEVPVVATTRAIEAFAAPAGCALVADSTEDFAAAILRVLGDATLARSLGAKGRAHVAAEYAQDAVATTAAQMLTALLDQPPPRRWRAAPQLQVNELDDGLAVFDPLLDRVHQLNPIAAMVFTLATEPRTVEEISTDLTSLIDDDVPIGATVEALRTARVLIAAHDANASAADLTR